MITRRDESPLGAFSTMISIQTININNKQRGTTQERVVADSLYRRCYHEMLSGRTIALEMLETLRQDEQHWREEIAAGLRCDNPVYTEFYRQRLMMTQTFIRCFETYLRELEIAEHEAEQHRQWRESQAHVLMYFHVFFFGGYLEVARGYDYDRHTYELNWRNLKRIVRLRRLDLLDNRDKRSFHNDTYYRKGVFHL